jgi:hypothetical protein
MEQQLNTRKASRKDLWVALGDCIKAAPPEQKKALREAMEYYRKRTSVKLTRTGRHFLAARVVVPGGRCIARQRRA